MTISAKIGRLLILSVALATVLPLGIGVYSFLSVFSGFDGTYDRATPVECAIIFGAAVHSVSDPGPAILRRVDAGVRLYQDNLVSRFIFAGGKGSDEQHSEAEVMREVATSAGIPPDIIRIEPFSGSTWENIRNSLPLLQKCSSLVAVSDRYHLARIRLIGKRQGIELQTFPAEMPPAGLFEIRSILRETIGYAYYLIWR